MSNIFSRLMVIRLSKFNDWRNQNFRPWFALIWILCSIKRSLIKREITLWSGFPSVMFNSLKSVIQEVSLFCGTNSHRLIKTDRYTHPTLSPKLYFFFRQSKLNFVKTLYPLCWISPTNKTKQIKDWKEKTMILNNVFQDQHSLRDLPTSFISCLAFDRIRES